ncbi:reverse transcriptase domain-containing protein [Tanacetum coccineum]
MKQNGVSYDALRLSLFPYSLTYHAIAWYDRLPRNSIHSFDDMMRKFLSKYFPPSMVTKLRNEIMNFRQDPNESLFEAWEHYKLSIDRCPNHNMLLVTQIDTFYNGLTLRHQDTINVAAGGTFMQKTPKECYDLIENMTAHHNHWDISATRDETSRTISSTTTTESPEVIRQLEMTNKNFLDMMRQIQSVKSVNTKCETCGGPYSFTECPAIGGYTQEAVYATTEVEREPEPEVVPKPNAKPSIPYPSRLNDQKLHEKANYQMLKFLQIFQSLHFDLSFADALLHMPKFASTFKSLLSNKEKLFELANTPLNENCLAVLLKKLPEKLGDPGKFLIPYDFLELDKCLALANLGSSINLMPLSVWKKLSLLELTPTRITLELANRSVAYPVGVAEDVFVKVGKFHFLADFVVVDYDVDPWVPFILGRPFLRTARALIDVHGEELILRDGDEQLIFHVDNTSKHPHESINMINFIYITYEDRFPEVLKFKKSNHPSSGSTTPFSDSLLEEFADELALLDPFPSGNEDDNFVPETNLRKIKFLLNQELLTESSLKTDIEIIDPILERFIDEPSHVYSPPPRDDDDDNENLFTTSLLVLPTMVPEDSLIMGDVDLSTIPEKESDEVIKSSDEDLVPILRESEDTDDASFPEEDVQEENFKIYSNPLFEFDDEYISSDVNPLFNEVLEDIKSEDSYVSNFDEPVLPVIPLFDANKDECFDPGDDIDEINAFLDMDVSMDFEDDYYDSEGYIIYLESLLIKDTIPNLPP